MAYVKNEVRATFVVKDNTDLKRFRKAVRGVFNGNPGEGDVDFFHNNLERVVCGRLLSGEEN